MSRSPWLLVLFVCVGACSTSVNVEQERNTLMQRDRDWSAATKTPDTWASFLVPDAAVYAPGSPVTTGADAVKKMFTDMTSAPGFSISWTPTKADVAASGDVGYTAGTYNVAVGGATEKGKYVTLWKKMDGQWKVAEDIFNADGHGPVPPHLMVSPSAITWGPGPPSLPPGAKMAVISGDPSQPVPFIVRAQVPAGYKVPPHWHPTTENLTILSGTVALGMGDTFDAAKMTEVPTGGAAVLPAEMRHSFLAKTAATFQVHGIGPFALTYVNPADDPRNAKQ